MPMPDDCDPIQDMKRARETAALADGPNVFADTDAELGLAEPVVVYSRPVPATEYDLGGEG